MLFIGLVTVLCVAGFQWHVLSVCRLTWPPWLEGGFPHVHVSRILTASQPCTQTHNLLVLIAAPFAEARLHSADSGPVGRGGWELWGYAQVAEPDQNTQLSRAMFVEVFWVELLNWANVGQQF